MTSQPLNGNPQPPAQPQLQLARVRALHVPEWVVVDYVGGSVCRECREPVESEPCATIRALDGAS